MRMFEFGAAMASAIGAHPCRRAAALLLTIAAATTCAPARALTEEAKLTDATLAAGANSGASVSISNTTAVIGAPAENGNAGAAYVYLRTGPSTWTLQQKLTASDAAANALFGTSVSISGDRIAIGAPGRSSNRGGVYTFSRASGVWTQGAPLQSSDGASGDKFGTSVSIAGTTLAAGAPFHAFGSKAGAGQGYIVRFSATTQLWTQFSILQNSNGQVKANDHLGFAVSLSGNTAVVGAPDMDFNNNTDSGGVIVFVASNKKWTRQANFNPGTSAGDRFGAAVSLFVNTALIGAPLANGARGRVFAYTRAGTTWTQFPNTGVAGAIVATDAAAGDNFGASVAVSGQLAAIGAPLAASAAGAGGGKAYVFGNTGAAFTSIDALTVSAANTPAAGDALGTSAALDAGRALVGAPFVDTPQAEGGAAYVYAVAQTTTTSVDSTTPAVTIAGQGYDVAVTVTATTPPSGTVAVDDGDGASCTVTLAPTGVATSGGTCTLVSIGAGVKTITASYAGTLVFGASQGTGSHTVNGADTTTTISAHTPDPSLVGQSVTFTVAVAVTPPGTGSPTGTVDVLDGATLLCTVADITVSTSCSAPFATVGTHSLTASYSGDADFNPSTSSPATSHVVAQAQTTTALNVAPNPVPGGTQVTLTATVSPTAPASGPPNGAAYTGTVDFFDGMTLIASGVTVSSSGVATATTFFQFAGMHPVHAVFNGDTNYAGSTSADVMVDVTSTSDLIFKDSYE